MTDEPLFTREQVADLLGVSVSTVRRRIEEGKLRAIKVGSLVRIEPDDLRNYRALCPEKERNGKEWDESLLVLKDHSQNTTSRFSRQ